MEIRSVGENAAIIYFGSKPDPETLIRVSNAVNALERQKAIPIVDLIPSYTSIVVIYRSDLIGRSHFRLSLKKLLYTIDNESLNNGKVITLPSYYAEESGADLRTVAELTGLSINDVIQLHSEREYLVYAVGFAPGFAYLGELDPQLCLPRKTTPRLKVPRGSVAIAANQTAVYPRESPGGWHLIGRCPLALFDPQSDPPTPFSVGDRVRFRPISKREFICLGGVL